MLYLITPTGNRFIQFGFCVEMMTNQTFTEDVTWIIADDGEQHVETPTVKNWNIIHLKRPHQKGNSQGNNMIACLEKCDQKSKILIIEDDDYYSINWLQIMSNKLDHCELCGETKTRYYNIINKTYRRNINNKHSSLCSTGLHSAMAYDMLLQICSKKPKFIDIHLWHNFKGKKCLFEGTNIVGIKGIPGKRGIGSGHDGLRNKDNANLSILKQWVGETWTEKYTNILKDINK